MNIILKGIEKVFNCSSEYINTVIIENQKLFCELITDIDNQIQGNEGLSVLSEENKSLRFDKRAELITQFIPFDINKKNIINKINSEMLSVAVDDSHILKTNQLLAQWEKYCMDLEIELPANIEFTKINVDSLIKAAGLSIVDDYCSLIEKIIDYFQLVENFECKKMFILINLRSIVENSEMRKFMEAIIQRNYTVIMIENREYEMIEYEKRYIIDADRCEICYN